MDRALTVAKKITGVRDRLRSEALESWERKSETSDDAAADRVRAERASARKTRISWNWLFRKKRRQKGRLPLWQNSLHNKRELAENLPEESGSRRAGVQRSVLLKAARNAKEQARRLTALVEKASQEASEARAAVGAATEQAESALQLAQQAATELTESTTALASAEAVLEEAEADLGTAKKVAAASEKPIRSLAFSPDSVRLATGGDGHLIHIWDSEGGQALDTLQGAGTVVHALTFTPGGETPFRLRQKPGGALGSRSWLVVGAHDRQRRQRRPADRSGQRLGL